MKQPTIYPTPDKLCEAAADFWLAAYSAAIIEHDSFHVAFSGGTTPKKLYEKLATSSFQSKINWKKVHIYFGDERFVPLDHADSNYNMANNALLNGIDCPEANIHTVNVAANDAEAAAAEYEATLVKYLPQNNKNKPQFDLVLLGLGPDGHTASLFPETDAVNEKEKLCRAVYVGNFCGKRMDSWRVSITFVAINSAAKILLLSEGSSKADIIKSLTTLQNTSQTTSQTNDLQYPVQHVRQDHGFFWYADQAAIG